MMKYSAPFTAVLYTIVLGNEYAASSSSSDMWAAASQLISLLIPHLKQLISAASAPRRGITFAMIPTNVEVPLLPHPESKNPVHTSLEDDFLERTNSGINTQKKPQTWNTRRSTSTIGSCFARKVLKNTAKATTAMTSSVPCHLS